MWLWKAKPKQKTPPRTHKNTDFLFYRWNMEHFCHLKVKPISCMSLHSLVIIKEKYGSSLGMIFPLSFVFFLLIHMSCSSKAAYFMPFQVTLLLKLCRLYQRKHISQKCLCSTLWTAQLPKSNLKWRTTFSNILSELHMDISQTQDWAAEGALNSPSAVHSAHHWCLTHSKVIITDV